MPQRPDLHLHLISDSTGETLHMMSRASLAMFADSTPTVHVSVFVRSDDDLREAIDKVRAAPGLVIFTLTEYRARAGLLAACEEIGVIAIGAIDHVISALSAHLGRAPSYRPGMQHRVTSAYLQSMAALDFAMAHDDGALDSRLMAADVILVGVSRTSKTPTCIYLAHRGIKAANVPLIPNTRPDAALLQARQNGVPVIGLTASPNRLSQIRTQRLETLGMDRSNDYAEIDLIRGEVAEARLFFERHAIPVIDVTRRSIEETSAEILVVLRRLGSLND